jgi:hypothetical protein
MPFLAALVIFVLVLIVIGIFTVTRGDGLTEEERVGRAAVGQNDALQRKNYADFRTYTCAAKQGQEADVLTRQQASEAKDGARYVDDVTAVRITGDAATAVVKYHFDKVVDTTSGSELAFVKEDGAWKVC